MKGLKSSFFFYTLALLAVEYLVRAEIFSVSLIPRPTQIFEVFWYQSEVIFPAFFRTAGLSIVAYFIASGFAFFLALLVRPFPRLQMTLMPITVFFQTVPIIALAPLLVIYLGFGIPSILSAALIVCFFPVFASTLVGLSVASKNHVELFTFLKATRWQKLFQLEIPSSVPHILGGLKTAAGLSVVGVVSGEFVAGGGLGALIDSARLQQRVDLVFTSLICLSLIGLALMRTTEFLFRLIFKSYFVKIG